MVFPLWSGIIQAAIVFLSNATFAMFQFAPEFDKECFQHTNEDFPRGFSTKELFAYISKRVEPNLAMFNVVKMLRVLGKLS